MKYKKKDRKGSKKKGLIILLVFIIIVGLGVGAFLIIWKKKSLIPAKPTPMPIELLEIPYSVQFEEKEVIALFAVNGMAEMSTYTKEIGVGVTTPNGNKDKFSALIHQRMPMWEIISPQPGIVETQTTCGKPYSYEWSVVQGSEEQSILFKLKDFPALKKVPPGTKGGCCGPDIKCGNCGGNSVRIAYTTVCPVEQTYFPLVDMKVVPQIIQKEKKTRVNFTADFKLSTAKAIKFRFFLPKKRKDAKVTLLALPFGVKREEREGIVILHGEVKKNTKVSVTAEIMPFQKGELLFNYILETSADLQKHFFPAQLGVKAKSVDYKSDTVFTEKISVSLKVE